jgi:hypothetical protein
MIIMQFCSYNFNLDCLLWKITNLFMWQASILFGIYTYIFNVITTNSKMKVSIGDNDKRLKLDIVSFLSQCEVL